MNIKFKIAITRKPKISFSEIVLENITREGPQIPFAAEDAKVRVETNSLLFKWNYQQLIIVVNYRVWYLLRIKADSYIFYLMFKHFHKVIL